MALACDIFLVERTVHQLCKAQSSLPTLFFTGNPQGTVVLTNSMMVWLKRSLAVLGTWSSTEPTVSDVCNLWLIYFSEINTTKKSSFFSTFQIRFCYLLQIKLLHKIWRHYLLLSKTPTSNCCQNKWKTSLESQLNKITLSGKYFERIHLWTNVTIFACYLGGEGIVFS